MTTAYIFRYENIYVYMHVRMIVRYTLVVFNVRCLFFHIHYCSLLQLLW